MEIKKFTVKERKCQYCNRKYWTPESLQECEGLCKRKHDREMMQANCEHVIHLCDVEEVECVHCSSHHGLRFEIYSWCKKCGKHITKTLSVYDIPNKMLKELLT